MDLDAYTCGWWKLLHTWMVRFSRMRKVSFPSYPHSIFSIKCLDFHLLISPRPFWQREATRPFFQVCSNGRLRLRINGQYTKQYLVKLVFIYFFSGPEKFPLPIVFVFLALHLFIYIFYFTLSFFI